jgi:hypothetical protein
VTEPHARLEQYRHSDAVTDLVQFPDRAHSLTIDSGWPEVADSALTWLTEPRPLPARPRLDDSR